MFEDTLKLYFLHFSTIIIGSICVSVWIQEGWIEWLPTPLENSPAKIYLEKIYLEKQMKIVGCNFNLLKPNKITNSLKTVKIIQKLLPKEELCAPVKRPTLLSQFNSP